MSPFEPRPLILQLLASPLTFLLRPVYALLLRLRGAPYSPSNVHPIRVVCVSDTHTLHCAIPDGDLLIHAGDLSNDGSAQEIQETVNWLKGLPHPHKVVVCGNHDSYFDVRARREEDRCANEDNSGDDHLGPDSCGKINWGDIHYLQHSSTTLSFSPPSPMPSSRPRNLTIYGAPQVPALGGPEHAFQYPHNANPWLHTIPRETDILVTHTPPQAHRDLSPDASLGCPFLLQEVWVVRPVLHVFGHVHAGYGCEPVFWDEAQRAWERLCARAKQAKPGLLGDLLGFGAWLDVLKVLGHSTAGVLWHRVWGGASAGGWMVNAACMYRSTGRLANQPQVVNL